MALTRTEAPTARRIAEARNRGQVAYSPALAQAAAVAAVLGVFGWGATAGVGRIVAYLRDALASAPAAQSVADLGPGLGRGLREAGLVLALPLGAAWLVVVMLGLVQTGANVTAQPLRAGGHRLLGMPRTQSLGGIAWGLLALALVTFAVGSLAVSLMRPIASLAGAEARRVWSVLAAAGQLLAVRLVLVAVTLGLADWLWRRHRLQQSLRMTREELAYERKETEGEPRLKAERRRVHGTLAERHGLLEIRNADLVVVDDGEVTVALRYDRNAAGAPRVVLKGERLVAVQLEALARHSGVPVFQDAPLARALRDLNEGGEIPPALYEPVAELLRDIRPRGPSGPLEIP